VTTSRKPKLPKVRFACFCERAIQDKDDNVWSLVRIADRAIITAVSDDLELESMRALLELTFFANLIGFEDVSPMELSFGIVPPGKRRRQELGKVQVNPSGDRLGTYVRIRLRIGIEGAGTYWFDLRSEDRVVVKLPLDIENRLEPQAST
jgi:hypothetical protein